MNIWDYRAIASDAGQYYRATECPFCSVPLDRLYANTPVSYSKLVVNNQVNICPTCGWWKYVSEQHSVYSGITVDGAVGSLKEFTAVDLGAPIAEIRDYLSARYERRFMVHPRVFEETVASVFRDLGFKAIVTAYQKDNGIDVILDSGSETIGIQVKRHEATIGVEQIRALVGALVRGNITEGVFVTTSRFSQPARLYAEEVATPAQRSPLRIELIDADRFYKDLRIAQRTRPRSLEDLDLASIEANLTTVFGPTRTLGGSSSSDDADDDDDDGSWFPPD